MNNLIQVKSVLKLAEIFNKGDYAGCAQCFTEDGSVRFPSGEVIVGRDAIQEKYSEFAKSIPDVNYRVDKITVTGPLSVAIDVYVSGTHLNPYQRTPEFLIPASGRKIGIPQIVFFTVNESGAILTEEKIYDVRLLMEQLGVAPDPKLCQDFAGRLRDALTKPTYALGDLFDNDGALNATGYPKALGRSAIAKLLAQLGVTAPDTCEVEVEDSVLQFPRFLARWSFVTGKDKTPMRAALTGTVSRGGLILEARLFLATVGLAG